MLISINGYYGSGGNELGKALAKDLGYTVYDNDLMEKAVAKSGIDMQRSTLAFYDEDDARIDEKIGGSYKNAVLSLQMDVLPIAQADRVGELPPRENDLLSLYMDTVPVNYHTFRPISRRDEIDRLKSAQISALLEAADKGDAVFFGRCSSYILNGRADALRIFVTASLESCCKRIGALYGITDQKQLEEFVKKTNNRRAYYFETFTKMTWDDAQNYDLCINTDYLGFDGTLTLLKKIISEKQSAL